MGVTNLIASRAAKKKRNAKNNTSSDAQQAAEALTVQIEQGDEEPDVETGEPTPLSGPGMKEIDVTMANKKKDGRRTPGFMSPANSARRHNGEHEAPREELLRLISDLKSQNQELAQQVADLKSTSVLQEFEDALPEDKSSKMTILLNKVNNIAKPMSKMSVDELETECDKATIVITDSMRGNSIKLMDELDAVRPRPECTKPWPDYIAGNATLRTYQQFAQFCDLFVYHLYVQNFILGVIILAGFMVGLSQYNTAHHAHTAFGVPEDLPNWIIVFADALDIMINVVFTAEVFLKIAAEGLTFWVFFLGKESAWNIFDFAIMVMCLSTDPNTGSNIKLLRLARLLRLVKLVNKIPQLKIIVMGLTGGISSIFYILLLMFLIFYLYAILGMLLYSVNDPWHFGTLEDALLTLFRMATLEDWTDVMYINYLGCKKYGYPMNYRIDTEKGEMMDYGSWHDDKKCVGFSSTSSGDPHAWLMPVTLLYMISFILLSALVMMSLFIGVVTQAMQEGVDQMNAEKEEKSKMSKDKKVLSKGYGKAPSEGQAHLLRQAEAAWSGKSIASLESAVGLPDPSPLEHRLAKIGAYMEQLQYHPSFVYTMATFIMIAGVLVGVDVQAVTKGHESPVPAPLEDFILVLFTIEVLVKMTAYWSTRGKWWALYQFFPNGWNLFDFGIVVACLVEKMSTGLTPAFLLVLRLVRLFRVLKLVRSLPQLQIIVFGLWKGVGSIGFIAVLLIMVFYMFAILGMVVFETNDPVHFGNLHIAIVTLFRCSTMEDWTDVMYINMLGCDKYGYGGGNESLCTNPQPHGVMAAIYFLVFIVIAALVMLTLFIGVVTTGMEEAGEEMAEMGRQQRIITAIGATYKISGEHIARYMKIFALFDEDGSGAIDMTELHLAMKAIGEDMDFNTVHQIFVKEMGVESGEVKMAEWVLFMARRDTDHHNTMEEEVPRTVYAKLSGVFKGSSDGDRVSTALTSEGIPETLETTVESRGVESSDVEIVVPAEPQIAEVAPVEEPSLPVEPNVDEASAESNVEVSSQTQVPEGMKVTMT